MADASSGRLLTIQDVALETSLSRATIYRMIRRGAFPAPRQVSANRVAWMEEAVSQWIRQKFAGPPT